MRDALHESPYRRGRNLGPVARPPQQIRPVAQGLARGAEDFARKRRAFPEDDAIRRALAAEALRELAQRVVVGMLHMRIRAIDEFYCDYTNIITMLLTDSTNRYRIELTLYNIKGDMHFDMWNGFFSGFTIDEFDYSGCDNNFHLYSFEQDIEFDLYCEKIRAVLM